MYTNSFPETGREFYHCTANHYWQLHLKKSVSFSARECPCVAVCNRRVAEDGLEIAFATSPFYIFVEPCRVEESPCAMFVLSFGVFDKRRNGAVKRDGKRKTPPGEIRKKIQDPLQWLPYSQTSKHGHSRGEEQTNFLHTGVGGLPTALCCLA